MPTAIRLSLLVLLCAPRLVHGQGRAQPKEVAAAVLRADSAGDWRSLLRFAHPEALLVFRAQRVLQLRALTDAPRADEGFGPGLDSTTLERMREIQTRQVRQMLDSAFLAPDTDSLGRMAPDSVFARWIRFAHRRAPGAPPVAESPIRLRLVGVVVESDSIAYAVVIRSWPTAGLEVLPAEFEVLGRQRDYPEVMMLRRSAGEWRSMLDTDMFSNIGVSIDLLHGE